MKGRVIKSMGLWSVVKNMAGDLINCRIKGSLKNHNKISTNLVTVGDFVSLSLNHDGTGNINAILKRKNYITRQSVKNTNHSHLIASNVDQVVIMVSLIQPITSLGFIDRILITAESFRIPCTILFNKQDLYDKSLLIKQENLSTIYQEIGYRCYFIQLFESKLKKSLFEIFNNKLSLLTGQSGVGKSTLVNQLISENLQKTNKISTSTGKGIHTTTTSEIFSLKNNTYIIDTPGIKEWGLLGITKSEIGHYFPEFREIMNQCKFNDCLHDKEPHCAVKNNVNEGKIAESRYYSYLSMLYNLESIK